MIKSKYLLTGVVYYEKTAEQVSHNMRQIKNKDSVIELTLRRELWHRGLRYRKNVKSIFGKPDIAFIGKKVAVFCDSEFWHGYAWEISKDDFQSNQDFWINKIERNIQRDKEVNDHLRKEGWIVLRFWGREIIRDTSACADIIHKALESRVAAKHNQKPHIDNQPECTEENDVI